MADTVKLRPCPICGGAMALHDNDWADPPLWRQVCSSCGLSTGEYPSRDLAIEKGNCRSPIGTGEMGMTPSGRVPPSDECHTAAAHVALTPPELEEAIKHVTAYDDCQVGMLEYSMLWRLIVAARQYIWMLKRTEELTAHSSPPDDPGNVDISDILKMNGRYTAREFLDQRLSSPTLTTRILERIVSPSPIAAPAVRSAEREVTDK